MAVVSVESQLSCSAASVGATEAAVDPDAEAPPPPLLLLDAAAAALPVASAGASDSDVLFVHCRAFFYREKDHLLLRPQEKGGDPNKHSV